LVTYNEALFVAQSRTLLREIAKRQQQLQELSQRLMAWQAKPATAPRRPTMEGTRKTLAGILQGRHMKELFRADLSRLRLDGNGVPGWLRLTAQELRGVSEAIGGSGSRFRGGVCRDRAEAVGCGLSERSGGAAELDTRTSIATGESRAFRSPLPYPMMR